MSTKTLNGSCLCGKITYEIDLPASEPNPKIAVCHCISCKKYTGSAFSSNLMLTPSMIRYTSSTKPSIFTDKSADSGKPLARALCSECGSHFTSSPEDAPWTALKWGTLDDAARAQCAELGGEIYCKRRDGWVDSLAGDREGLFKAEAMM
ncbi:hypothetical protein ASPSYDRAFT_93505 [Aspergillus sydowii CBS 593.65]|uniref:CENP-V/GFA domain-containing protein n=1 Tax=Aspergillus sydowii CBS 593.65 TaxID=1036612 RepID=A0A1L9T598_9EURO|nr:uncharacterized protein ASPSYDRAFT_93505 [Aspergillus sydowii CBS 593.65]OJJ54587.1 hypothetical protein ASPSYDRAFT_93505 [Aspergillus sydowii CBS 593.65]